MEAASLRPYWILDYGNTCYTPDHGCDTPACIAAFASFALATVAHFGGHGIIFECLK